MLHELINFFLVIILVMIQSVAGVGVLVLGTPTLLLLDISLIETMNYLLPISIITSLVNLIIMKLKINSLSYDKSRFILFFIICIPFVFVGLIILKLVNDLIKIDYLVAIIIISTLIFKKKISLISKNLSLKANKIILMIIGIIHGLTNSGGTLLSILLININTSKKRSRSEITLFYFFLALIQFVLFYFIFGITQNIYKYHLIILYIFIGIILGNICLKFTSDILFRKLIFFLAFISSISLILKNII
tara:strand:+ start:550 stop:1293 length:744 start_codon:yes stop_codon:yes gene_type:complete